MHKASTAQRYRLREAFSREHQHYLKSLYGSQHRNSGDIRALPIPMRNKLSRAPHIERGRLNVLVLQELSALFAKRVEMGRLSYLVPWRLLTLRNVKTGIAIDPYDPTLKSRSADSLLPYRGVLSFRSEARKALAVKRRASP